MNPGDTATDQHRADARFIWDYHQMNHQLRPCSAGIGLGSHDLGVARNRFSRLFAGSPRRAGSAVSFTARSVGPA